MSERSEFYRQQISARRRMSKQEKERVTFEDGVSARCSRELNAFERERDEQEQRDQALARMDSGRSGRARGGYGLRW